MLVEKKKVAGVEKTAVDKYRRSRDSPADDDCGRVQDCSENFLRLHPQGMPTGGLPATHHGGRRRVLSRRRHWHRSVATSHGMTNRPVA